MEYNSETLYAAIEQYRSGRNPKDLCFLSLYIEKMRRVRSAEEKSALFDTLAAVAFQPDTPLRFTARAFNESFPLELSKEAVAHITAFFTRYLPLGFPPLGDRELELTLFHLFSTSAVGQPAGWFTSFPARGFVSSARSERIAGRKQLRKLVERQPEAYQATPNGQGISPKEVLRAADEAYVVGANWVRETLMVEGDDQTIYETYDLFRNWDLPSLDYSNPSEYSAFQHCYASLYPRLVSEMGEK